MATMKNGQPMSPMPMSVNCPTNRRAPRTTSTRPMTMAGERSSWLDGVSVTTGMVLLAGERRP